MLEWAPPAAGPIAFPRLRLTGGDATAHCTALLKESAVMLIPEALFGFRPEVPTRGARAQRVRVGLGRLGMEEGLARWGKHLDRLLRS